ncbi:MAG TPA: hypothetical protein VG387_18285 [Rhizomicrobium sp.]|nr:hypothetical protein [Rhizomicrobium sp.]
MLLVLLCAGTLLSFAIFPEAAVAVVFDDTGQPLSEIAALVLPGFLTSLLFVIAIVLVVACLIRVTPRRLALVAAGLATLALYIVAIPRARAGFQFDVALYRQTACEPHSTAYLCR